MTDVAAALDVLRAGGLVIVPTDTVYGLACLAEDEGAVRRIQRLKGRADATPIAMLGADVGAVVALVPELRGRSETRLRALLPDALTVVLPNPARRLPWLSGGRPDTIGVRVPVLAEPMRRLVESVGVIAATSANPSGVVAPWRLEDVVCELRDAVGASVDGGALPGTASTVVDLSGSEPVVLREGAIPADVVLERAASAG